MFFNQIDKQLKNLDEVFDKYRSLGYDVPASELDGAMQAVFDAYQIGKLLSISEIQSIREMVPGHNISTITSAVTCTLMVIREYLDRTPVKTSELEDAIRLVRLVKDLKNMAPDQYFSSLKRKAFLSRPPEKDI